MFVLLCSSVLYSMLSSALLKVFCSVCALLDAIFSSQQCSALLWKGGMYGYDGLVKLVRMGTVVCLKLARMLVHMVLMVQ